MQRKVGGMVGMMVLVFHYPALRPIKSFLAVTPPNTIMIHIANFLAIFPSSTTVFAGVVASGSLV
jgi:hypothetical protein